MDSCHSTNVGSSWPNLWTNVNHIIILWGSTQYDLYYIFLYCTFQINLIWTFDLYFNLFVSNSRKLWKFPPIGNFSPVSRQFPSNCRFYFQPSVLSAATLPSFDIFGNPCEILNPKQPHFRNNPICVQLGSHALFKTFPDVWQLGGFGSAGKLYAANVANNA